VLGGALLAALAGSAARAEDDPRPAVEDLRATREAQRLVVSYRVSGALTDEVLERIQSGIPVTFEHELEVVARRALPLWPARVLVRRRLRVQVTYDALTRQYALSRETELHQRGQADAEPTVEHASVEAIDAVETWMTVVATDCPMDEVDAKRSGRLRLRVESELGRRYVLLLFPGQLTASAEQELGP
jgi:hypothetical protein